MIIGHDTRNHIIELTGNTFDPWDPPTPAAVEDMINVDDMLDECLCPYCDGRGISGITVVDVTYQSDGWFVEYEPPELDFEAIMESRREARRPAYVGHRFWEGR